ncbi:MAG: hypothetical protein ACLFQB_15905 [Chitinispirillaceae bacterium]
MKYLLIILLITVASAFAGEESTNLDEYKKKENFAWAETTLTVAEKEYRLVNIRNKDEKADTACVSAILFDKRKLVFTDYSTNEAPHGLVVPSEQPVKNGLIILKPSPSDAKALLIFPSGKMVVLPGASVLVDAAGKMVYDVWNDGGQHKLSVFNYKSHSLLLSATPIPKPVKWYSAVMDYQFTTEDKKMYTVDLMGKSVRKVDGKPGDSDPLKYVGGVLWR